MQKILIMQVAALLLMMLPSCRDEDVVFIPEEVDTGVSELTSVGGFYLLNEGNMGSNKASLDRYDYITGHYTRNIYGSANPDVPMELGDVGNSLAVYGNRLYAILNCSNKLEVMDLRTAKRIGQVNIPNCRHIAFKDGYAYISSYAGPVEISPIYKQRGFVAKIDTASLQEVARCIVGYQPDGVAVVADKLYVANSGGYMAPHYQRTVSVIDLATFEVTDEVEIAPNLNLIVADRRGRLWISSRGDYTKNVPSLVCYDTRKHRVELRIDITASSMWLCGDSLYIVGGDNIAATDGRQRQYAIINTEKLMQVSSNFITDGSEARIKLPYAVAVNPVNKDIFVCDAGNYVNPGWLYCYTPDGVMKWRVRTGDIPAHIAFFPRAEAR